MPTERAARFIASRVADEPERRFVVVVSAQQGDDGRAPRATRSADERPTRIAAMRRPAVVDRRAPIRRPPGAGAAGARRARHRRQRARRPGSCRDTAGTPRPAARCRPLRLRALLASARRRRRPGVSRPRRRRSRRLARPRRIRPHSRGRSPPASARADASSSRTSRATSRRTRTAIPTRAISRPRLRVRTGHGDGGCEVVQRAALANRRAHGLPIVVRSIADTRRTEISAGASVRATARRAGARHAPTFDWIATTRS